MRLPAGFSPPELYFVAVLVASGFCGVPGYASGPVGSAFSGRDVPNRAFFAKHCYDCHQGDSAEGGLDLERLGTDLNDPDVELRWIRVYDRIHKGEMPPPDSRKLSPRVAAPALKQLNTWITQYQRERQADQGRVQGRRLTRREMDRTLRDLLGISKPLLEYYQEEPKQAEFSTVARGQSLSDVTVGEHLNVIDIALDEAFR